MKREEIKLINYALNFLMEHMDEGIQEELKIKGITKKHIKNILHDWQEKDKVVAYEL